MSMAFFLANLWPLSIVSMLLLIVAAYFKGYIKAKEEDRKGAEEDQIKTYQMALDALKPKEEKKP